ncbi:MAG: sulfite exporter TauE/SafE family protein [Pseudolabrys sp.]
MDGIGLGLFLVAAFLGGFASGLAGFAMGFVVSGIWLHIITPVQTTVLIVGYGLWTQGYGVWKLRHSLQWRSLAPFIIGGVIGVPVGTMLLTWVNPGFMRGAVGVLLVLFSIYGLVQPKFTPVRSGVPADSGAGFLNGVVCGLTGLPGLIITIWCQFRGWPKDIQRAIFQPVMLGAIVVTAVSVSFAGVVTAEIVKLYLLGLPAMVAGLALGFKLYGKINDAVFRKVVLMSLFLSGWALIVAQLWPLIRHRL